MKIEAPSWFTLFATVVTILLSIFAKLWDPIMAHVGYPFGVERRLKQLQRNVRRLSRGKDDIEFWYPSPSSEERKGWLEDVSDLIQRVELIKTSLEKPDLGIWERCKIGIKVEDEVKETEALIVQMSAVKPEKKPSTTRQGRRSTPDATTGHVSQVNVLPPEVHIELPVSDPLPGMESPYNKVITFIKDNRPESVTMGIWGMGGVGKTTLINLVRDSRPTCRDDFLEVVLVQPGKGCTELADLQKAVANSLGLGGITNGIPHEVMINQHLENKNFLLLFDDLWKDFDLEKVGIPKLDVQAHLRKVVFTTRSIDVCDRMGCRDPDNTIQMKCLNKEDAWNLFAENVENMPRSKRKENTIFNHAEIHEIAEQIVEVCSGLPLALCAFGKYMSIKKDPREWRSARDLLKNSKLHEIPDIHDDLFKRLQESYDNLPGRMKKHFLVCSLWPENKNISMKLLTRWWTGLGLLDGYPNASDMGYTLIQEFVHLSMLENGDTGLESTEYSHIKMHNMIRMMAIWIVNEYGYKNKWLPNSSYRSTLAKKKWRTVEKAWVSEDDTSSWCQWSSTVRFPELKMLVARHVFQFELICFFQNITFLDLEGTDTNQFPVEICELIELRHLNLSGTTIGVLPLLLEKLKKLTYLYVRNNMDLQTIPRGLILALEKLRGLDLFSTGTTFEVLEELARFIKLEMLGITVRTIAEIAKLGRLERVCTQALYMHQVEDSSDPAIINLQILSELRELQELSIVQSFHNQKELVVEGAGPEYSQQLLPHLEIFELNNLLKLKTVTWKHAGVNIRVVSIYKCDELRDVTWVHHLKLLEQLTIAHCKKMEILIETEESPSGVRNNQRKTISFPRLKKLKLEELPKLIMICKQSCEFEELSYICVTRCDVKSIQYQTYKKSMVKIDCSEDWWKKHYEGILIPYISPTFCF